MKIPDSNSVGLPYKQTVEEHRNTEKHSNTRGMKDRMESGLSDGIETAKKHGARREIGAGLAPVRPDQCLKHRTKRKENTRTILSCLGFGRVFLSVPKNSESIRKRLINLTILKTHAPSSCKSCEKKSH